MLKLASGMLAAGQLYDSQRARPITAVRRGYDRTLLEVLFLRTAWPLHWGMYFDATPGQQFHAPTTSDGSTAELALEPVTNLADGTLWALRVWFRSFGWLLTFGKPDSLSPQMYRPAGLRMRRVGETCHVPSTSHGKVATNRTR
jgi:hypothetical protein